MKTTVYVLTNDKEITNGIKIHIRGEELDLNEVDPEYLADLMDEISDEEAEAIEDEIRQQLSPEQNKALDEQLAVLGEELKEEEEVKPSNDKDDSIKLPPIYLAVPADGEINHDIPKLMKGIEKGSETVGFFTALVNGGMTGKQAYDLIMTQMKYSHEIVMLEKQAEVQKEMKARELEVQLQIQGLKQLLSED